jgi:hypothetical protein
MVVSFMYFTWWMWGFWSLDRHMIFCRLGNTGSLPLALCAHDDERVGLLGTKLQNHPFQLDHTTAIQSR